MATVKVIQGSGCPFLQGCETWTLRADRIRTDAAQTWFSDGLRVTHFYIGEDVKKWHSICETVELYRTCCRGHMLSMPDNHWAKLRGITSREDGA